MSDKAGRAVAALTLILLGAYLLALQFFPALRVYALNESNWPLLLVGLGGVFLAAALLTRKPRGLVSAVVVSGVGAILYWQNATGNWASWAYMWTLLPGLFGIGFFLMHVMEGNLRNGVVIGGTLIVLSGAAFLLFSSMYGAFAFLGTYWPLLLVLLGVILLAQVFMRPR